MLILHADEVPVVDHCAGDVFNRLKYLWMLYWVNAKVGRNDLERQTPV